MSDYIKRSEALDAVPDGLYAASDQRTAGFVDCCERVKEYLEIIPAADVAPVVHGQWIWQSGDVYTCTACKADCHVDECMNEPQYDYCPNCGAKMDGGAAK